MYKSIVSNNDLKRVKSNCVYNINLDKYKDKDKNKDNNFKLNQNDYEFVVEKILGTGATSHIYLAHDKKNNLVVIKAIKSRYVDYYNNEIKIINKLNDLYKEPENKFFLKKYDNFYGILNLKDYYFIIYEYVENGKDLIVYINELIEQNIESNIEYIDFRKKETIIYEMSNCINQLHKSGISHLDIKPENFIISDYSGFIRVIVIDFGNSILFEELDDDSFYNGDCGTICYSPPELFFDNRKSFIESGKGDNDNDTKLGFKLNDLSAKNVDYWALGLSIYFIIFEKNAWKGINQFRVGYLISTGDFPFLNDIDLEIQKMKFFDDQHHNFNFKILKNLKKYLLNLNFNKRKIKKFLHL